jgi:nucleotide-binding universal stress UspA family protein
MAIKRLTVALDLSPLDEKVLTYTQFLCKSLPIEKIYFIHVEQKLDLPESYLLKHPELALPMDESLEAQMQAVVSQHLSLSENISTEFDVLEGEILNTLVRHSKVKLADLMIVGKRDNEAQADLVSEKLARRALCSVLFVPETFSLDIRHILVPCDFSQHAHHALETAAQISSVVDGDVIHVLNLFDVPSGYAKTGMSYEAFAADLKTYAEEDMQKFIQDVALTDSTIETHVTDTNSKDQAQLIRDWLQKLDCQLLVMGSKGRTNIAAMFLGSLTEKLIKLDLKVPILVIKKKNESLGFFQALIEGDL